MVNLEKFVNNFGLALMPSAMAIILLGLPLAIALKSAAFAYVILTIGATCFGLSMACLAACVVMDGWER